MDALLICGGEGTRLDADVEKPLFEIDGRPMVDRVAEALAASRIERVHAVCSPHAPETREHASELELIESVIDAPGEGYVADLQYAMERVDPPVVTVAADLPLLAGPVVDDVLDAFDGEGSLDVMIPGALKRELGVSADTVRSVDGRELAPTGLNVVGAGDAAAGDVHCSYDVRLAVNVNRPGDAEIAESLLADFPTAATTPTEH